MPTLPKPCFVFMAGFSGYKTIITWCVACDLILEIIVESVLQVFWFYIREFASQTIT